jgi:hypothetical protein
MESLEQGVDSPGVSRRRWVVGLIAAGILGALGVAAWQVDMRWREASASDIALAFDEALSAIETAERRVQSVSEYARPQSDRDDISLAAKASLEAMVQEAAVDSAADIARERMQINAVRLLPWHTSLQEARGRAVAWLDLRASGIVTLAATGRATYAPREQIDSARTALREAWEAISRAE